MAKVATRYLITGIIIVVVVSLIFAGLFNYLGFASQNNLKAVAEADREIVRVGESINFTAENSKGEIKSYYWDFGDGTSSKEVSPSHVFENPKWNNVTLIIEGKNNKKANSTLHIGIQCYDIFEEGESGVIVALRTGLGYVVTSEIGPHIGKPTIETEADVITAVGLIDFAVDLVWHESSEQTNRSEVYSESVTVIREDIHFSYNVMPNDIPDEIQKYPSEVWVSVVCWEGGWENAIIKQNVIFPVENVN
jgi:hypothetical protein